MACSHQRSSMTTTNCEGLIVITYLYCIYTFQPPILPSPPPLCHDYLPPTSPISHIAIFMSPLYKPITNLLDTLYTTILWHGSCISILLDYNCLRCIQCYSSMYQLVNIYIYSVFVNRS